MSKRRGHNRKRKIGNKYIEEKYVMIFLIIVIFFVSIIVIFNNINKQNNIKFEHTNLMSENSNETVTEALFTNVIGNKNVIDDEVQKTTEKQDIVIDMCYIGNVICEQSVYEDAYSDGDYNFSYMFENVKNYTESADITIGNIETNFIDSAYSGKNLYNSPKALMQELKNIGVDIVNIANNHSLDYGYNGLKSTVDYINSLEINTVGSKIENEFGMIVKEIQGIKLGFLSYTYGVNIVSKVPQTDKQYINLIDKNKILSDLKVLKEEQKVDYVCVNMHWGNYENSKINSIQEDLTKFLVENDVDLIIGTHPVELQHMEMIKKDEKNVLVVYSLGNFISSGIYKNSNLELILNIKLIKNAETGKTSLSKVDYIPVYLLNNGNKKQKYSLLDIEKSISQYEAGNTSNIDETLYKKLLKASENIEKVIWNK